MTETIPVFHPSCGGHHLAEVSLDPNGYPASRWVEPCDQATSKQEHLDEIGRLGGKALAFVVDVRDWGRAEEVLEQVLARNDPEEAAP